MSDAPEVSPAVRAVAAQRLAEDRAVSAALKVVRDPAGDLGAMRDALEALSPQSFVNVSERVASFLQEKAVKNGDFSVVERVYPYLPSAERIAEERGKLAEIMTQRENALVHLLHLSPDGRLVHAALDAVFADRQPNATTEVKQDISDYAAVQLSQREAKLGPVQLPQAAQDALDLAQFRARMTGQWDAVPAAEPLSVRPVTIRMAEEMVDLAQLPREGSPQRQPSITEATASAADALAAGTLRADLERRLEAARTPTQLAGRLSEERFREDRASLGPHPAQVAAIAVAIEETEAKLRAQPQRPSQESQAAAPVVELTRRGSNSASATPGLPDEPASIAAAYVVKERDGERHYFQRSDGQLAMRADETHIRGVLRDAVTIGAMLDLAEARGWNDVVVRGDREVARETWIQATVRGLAVEGFAPSRDDYHALEQRRAGVPPPPNLGAAEGSTMGAQAGTPSPPRRSAKEPWMDREDGFDALSPAMQASAERSYARWSSDNPDAARKHDLHDYVGYVQEQRAIERDQLRQPPPKVEMPPRPGMTL